MNKLSNLKNHQTMNLNVLSSTSSEFVSQINKNKNFLFSKGGANHTIEALNAFNSNNLDLALYILNNNNFNCNTQDKHGNTILHHLVNNCKDDEKCLHLITKILQFPDLQNFINIQNKNGQTPILISVLNENDNIAEILDSAGADKTIKDNDGNYVKIDQDSEKSNTPTVINVFNLSSNNDNTVDFVNKIKNNDKNLDSDYIYKGSTKHSTLLYGVPIVFRENNKNANVVDTSDSSFKNISDTDNFINKLKSKYGNENVNQSKHNKPANIGYSDTSSLPNLNIEAFGNSDNSKTSPLSDEINTERKKLLNEKTSDSNKSANTNKSITSSESVNTDDLLKAIDEIQGKEVKQKGGAKKSQKNKIMGFRNLIIDSDSGVQEKNKKDKKDKKDKNISISNDYDLLYNSDSEYGNMNNELARMMRSQKDEIHQTVLNNIMSLLDKGVLEKDSVSIEASERNARLIKTYIYRHISENNPQMGGLDKIIMFSKMTEQQIINLIKDMPKSLDEFEKELQKNIQEKQKSNPPKKNNKKSELKSQSESENESETDEKPKKKTKKETKTKESKSKKASKSKK